MTVGIIVLAAGQSKRFGRENKLLAIQDGIPLVRRVVQVAKSSKSEDVLVVLGWDETAVRDALDGLSCRFVFNPNYADGIGASISKGIREIGADVSGAMILPGDLVHMRCDVLDDLICAFEDADARTVIVPIDSQGEQRNPVIWPRSYFPKLMQLAHDRGGKALLFEGAVPPVVLQFDDDRVFSDIDVTGDLAVSENEPKSQ